jgi:lipopolysaccharide export system protein LptA
MTNNQSNDMNKNRYTSRGNLKTICGRNKTTGDNADVTRGNVYATAGNHDVPGKNVYVKYGNTKTLCELIFTHRGNRKTNGENTLIRLNAVLKKLKFNTGKIKHHRRDDSS